MTQTDRPFMDEPTEVLQTALDLADTHARQAARFRPAQDGDPLPAVADLLRAELRYREGQTLPPPQGPEYTPCGCSHIEPEHRPDAGPCLLCGCTTYRPGQPAAAVPPSADRVDLRQHLADALYPTYGQQDRNRSLDIADAVLAVLFGPIPADTDTATWTAIRAIQLMNEAGRQRDAVLPAPADRAAVLRDAAAAVRDGDLGPRGGMSSDYENGWWNSRAAAEERVRRLIDTAPTADQHVRGVQAWMALDLHQALGWPVDHSATIEHQGRKSWGDWWAELLAGVRNVQMIRRYRGELPEPTGDADSLRRMADETPATEHQPRRGDQFEAWLKTQRDEHRDTGRGVWTTLDDLLDRYRLHADTGTPLGEHVCEGRVVGDCGCLEQPAAGARQDGAQDRG